MKRKIGIIVLMALITMLLRVTLTITDCAPLQKLSIISVAEARPIVLKYATYYPETHMFTVADKNALEKIKKDSNGKIDFQYYTSGSLVGSKESYEQLKQGVCDLGYISSQYVPGFDLTKAQRAWWYGGDFSKIFEIYMKVLAKYPAYEAEWADVKVLTRDSIPPYHILTAKKAIRTIEDFKGLKIKAVPQFIEPLKKLGAEPINIPITETYLALQKGILDGTIIPLDTYKSFAFDEVIKYQTNLGYLMGPYPTRAMNVDTWNKLPKDIQQLFNDNLSYWQSENIRLPFEAEKAGIEAAKKAGVEIINFSSADLSKINALFEQDALKSVEELEAKGIPAKPIFQEIRRLIENR